MIRTIRCVVFSALLILIPALARAGDTAWRLIETEGQVETSNGGGGFIQASLSNEFVPGSVLRTGANGRAVIENNGDKITVAPNSVFELPGQSEGEMTHVKQSLGTALYDMVPRGVDRFRVDTPFLAAVIKGTVFTVNVTPQGGAVEVLRGVVQVTNGEGQFPTLVYPGQTATVASALRGGEVHLLGRPPAGTPQSVAPTPAAPKPSAGTTTAEATAVSGPPPASGLKIEHTLMPHAVAIGDLTNGLITKVDAKDSKKGGAGANASAGSTVSASAGSGSSTAPGATPVQTASLDPASVDATAGNGNDMSDSSAGSGSADNASNSGNGNGNGNGNDNGNAVSSTASSVASSASGAVSSASGLVSGVSSAASSAISSASISVAGAATTGNGNGNAGNGTGNGKGNNGNGNGNGGNLSTTVSSTLTTVTNLVSTVTTGNGNNGNGNGNGKGHNK